MRLLFGSTAYLEKVARQKRFFYKLGQFGAVGIVGSFLLLACWEYLTPYLQLTTSDEATVLTCFVLGCAMLVLSIGGYLASLLEEWSMPRIEKFVRRKMTK